jgi:hypothetical protein
MFANRIANRPEPPPARLLPGAFVVCPLVLVAQEAQVVLWQQTLYARAFAEAQAVVRPSLPERDLLGVWN